MPNVSGVFPLAVPTANVVGVTLPNQMRTAMLPGVGSPNRTAADQAKIDAVVAALPSPSGSYALTVAKSGTGSGTVTSSPSGISCGATCSASYTSGTVVTLGQTPAAGSAFAGWSGACAGTGSCQLTMDAAKSVTASFSVPSLSINDVALTEGHSGTKNATFTVTLAAAVTSAVSVNYATTNGTATAGSDYTAASGVLTFAAGETSKTLAVSLTGDTVIENDETFTVTLSGATGVTISDAQGVGTLTNDDFPALSISDVTVNEGNSGTTNAVFTVSLSATSPQTITVNYTTANGTATAGSDYAAQSGNLTFTAGQTTKTISVVVTGDTAVEANETFVVNLTAPSKATLADAQGQGTITNDDTTPPPPGGEAVVWENRMGVSVSAGSVTKTAAAAWGNSGAASSRAVNGNGYVELTLPASPGYAMFGLANGDTNQDYADIDFALYTNPGIGRLHVFEKGTYRGTFAAYAAGDKLKVAAESGVVKYYHNGTLLYTSAQTPTFPLRADIALYSTGATLQNATLSGTLVNVTPSTSEAVAWVNAAGVSVAAGSITKTAAIAWGNAGAASSRAVNGNGYVEFTLPATPGYAMFGLANGDTDRGYADIDFALYTNPTDGNLYIFEKGTYRGAVGAYASGDKLRVAAESGVVKYLRNGTLLYTSAQTLTYPLRADTSLYSTGAALSNVRLGGALVSVP